jgi:hypothetical protein
MVALTLVRSLFVLVLIAIAAYAGWSTYQGWHIGSRRRAAGQGAQPRGATGVERHR